MKQPDPETRGGEEPGNWNVSTEAQIAATLGYVQETFTQEPCGGGDTA